MKEISIIVAVAARGAIGRQGGLLCHLPADLRRFKSLTTGHSVVMGRRTFESLPHGPLPGRQNIVVTHNRHYHPQGVTVAHDVQQAIELATMPGEVFIIGGAQIYQAALPLAHTLHLTEIHAHFADADTFFPPLERGEWVEVERECHPADERHAHPYDFITLKRTS
ncbi:MAG: dihydrofolate reductase [Muribaculaceae bacterium]|nr:dihydrofolate reductase [Muribaculaceae bacterium]HAP50494.1 dihydrofolate reductase [Porphyromonadaceae bacterium]